jgi:predicted Rossmann fold nucleotide-binding protein DprA/Smf involved in DNA uptake
MEAAIQADSVTVGVLADSLVRTTRDPEMRRLIADGRVALCTPYKPTAGFSVANAMGRNKLIYALSQTTVVVASDLESGGTWAGAVEAIRQGIAPVAVWRGDGEGPGNAELERRGARACTSIDDLFPLIEIEATTDVEPAQLKLEL